MVYIVVARLVECFAVLGDRRVVELILEASNTTPRRSGTTHDDEKASSLMMTELYLESRASASLAG